MASWSCPSCGLEFESQPEQCSYCAWAPSAAAEAAPPSAPQDDPPVEVWDGDDVVEEPRSDPAAAAAAAQRLRRLCWRACRPEAGINPAHELWPRNPYDLTNGTRGRCVPVTTPAGQAAIDLAKEIYQPSAFLFKYFAGQTPLYQSMQENGARPRRESVPGGRERATQVGSRATGGSAGSSPSPS